MKMPTMIPRLSRIAVVLLLSCFVLSDFWAKTDAASESSNERIVCYYTNWAVYRQGIAKYSPENINPYLCTHLIYAFGGLTKDFELKPFDNYQDIEKGGYGKFVGLKTYNKELKTLIAVGGWNEGSTRWSPLVASKEHRHTFIRSAIRFLRTYNFDGLDLDWEYPAFRDGGQPEDKDNYATLVQELRTAFEREAAKSKKDRLLLTMAVPAGKEYIDRGYDIPKLNKYLDFFNMLTYDYHSAFEPQANHHAPLYIRRGLSDFDIKAELNIDFTVRYYVEEGADRDKLVVGIPTYGRSYTLFNPDSHDIGSPAEGPGEAGKYTKEKGYMAFYEVCENIAENEWQVKKVDPGAVGPYAYKGSQWVGYDDEQIAARKAMYVRDQKLGGIMFWSIDNDDFRGLCNGQPYPLIEGAKSALLSKSNSTSTTSGSKNSIAASTKDSSRSPKSKPASTSDSGSSSSTSSRLNTLNNRRNLLNRTPSTSSTRSRRPTNPSLDEIRRSKETTSAEEKTTPKPAAADPLSTPEPPTTPDPGTDFTCKEEGFFSHPRQCSKYFWCLDTPNLGLVSHQFTCPAGLYFNKISGSCDYPNNVICAKPKESTKAAFKTTTPTPTTQFSEDAAFEEERPRGYQLPTDEELFGGLDEEPTTTTTRKPEVTTKKRQRLTAVVVTTPRPTSVVTETDEASLQELLSVIDGLGGVSAVKSLLAKSGGRINTISPQLTHLDADALDRAVSALDSGHRRPNSLSFNGARGPQFTPSDNDADAEAAESADGQSRGQDNAEAGSLPSNQRGPQYVVFDRRKNGAVNEEEEEEAEPTEVPERQQRVTFNYVTIDRRSSSTTPASSDDGTVVNEGSNGDQEAESEDGQFVDGPSEDGSTFTVFAQPDRNNGRFTPSAKPSSLFRTTTAASVFPEYVTIRRENPQPAEEEEEDYVDEPATDGVIESSPEAPSSTEKAIHIRPLSFRRTRPPLTTTTTTPRPAVDRSRVRIKAPSPPSTRRPSVTPSRSAVFDVAKRRNNPLNSNRPPSRLFPRRDPPSTETSVEISSANPSLRIDDEAEVEEGEKKENVTITVTFREEIRSQSEQQPGGRTIRNRVKTTEIPLEDADKVSAADIFDSVGSSPGSRLDEVDESAQLTSAATGVSPVSTEAPESVEESSPSSPAPVRGRAGVRARVSLANILRAASPDRRNPLVGRRTRPVGLPASRSTFGAEDSSSAASDADSATEQPASGRSVPEAEQEPAVIPSRQQRGRRPGIVRTRARLPLRTGRVFPSSTEASIGDTSDGSALEESPVAVSASPRPIRRRPVRVRQQQFTPPPSGRVRSRTRLPVGSTTAAAKTAESDSNTNEEAIQTNEETVSERPARRPAPARVNVRRRPIQSTTESSPAVDAEGEQQGVRGVSIRPLSRPTPPVSRPNRRLVNRRPFITPASALRGTSPSTSSATPASIIDDVTSPASSVSSLLDEGEELSSFGAEEPSPRQTKHDSKPRSAREFSAPVIVPRIGDLSTIDIAGIDNRRQQRAEIDETQASASTDVLFATAPLFTTAGVNEKDVSIFSKSTPFGSKSTPPVEPNTPTATFTPIESEYHTETLAVDVGAIDVSVNSPQDSSASQIPERQQGRSVNGNWNSQNGVSPSPLRIKSVSPASSLLDAFRHQPPTFDFALFRSPAAPQQQSLFDADNAKGPFVAPVFGGQRFVSPSPASIHFSLKPDADYNYVYYDEPDYDTANLGTDNKFVDYYDSVLRLEKKLQTFSDGRIRCLDAGVFAHPQSCKKFVNCVREKDGTLKGWVYTCPSNLAFDPIGAICNWNDATFCGKGSSNDSARGKA